MILKAEGMVAPPLERLFYGAVDCSAYRIESVEKGWRGAYHQELAETLWMRHGLIARPERRMSTLCIRVRLLMGWYVMASVHPEIRLHTENSPPRKGGHFVLVYGFETTADGEVRFLVQNSAGFASIGTQVGVRVLERRMQQVFSGNAVAVLSPRHL